MLSLVRDAGGRGFVSEEEEGGFRNRSRTLVPPEALEFFTEIIAFSVSPAYLDREFLYQEYVVNGLSGEEIGLKIGSASSTVLKYLRLYDIPIRAGGDNIRPKRHLPFGKRIVGRSVEVNKTEHEKILKMARLRTDGFSYWKIADILNSMGGANKDPQGKVARQVRAGRSRQCHPTGRPRSRWPGRGCQ